MRVVYPREEVTVDNYGPIVSIVTWILLVSLVLFVCAKVAIKVIACHTFNHDDAVLLSAMVGFPFIVIFQHTKTYVKQIISAAQSISFSIQATNGVGQRLISLTESQVTSYQKVDAKPCRYHESHS